jgi:hypothetical protein
MAITGLPLPNTRLNFAVTLPPNHSISGHASNRENPCPTASARADM